VIDTLKYLFAEKEALALAVLKADPLSPLTAEAHDTPDPLDQFEKVTPGGGVVQEAIGVAGQVIVAPPPTSTTVCPQHSFFADSTMLPNIHHNTVVFFIQMILINKRSGGKNKKAIIV